MLPFIEYISETESNSQLARNLPENTLESKSDNHGNDENISFEQPPWYILLYNFLVTHPNFIKFGDFS